MASWAPQAGRVMGSVDRALPSARRFHCSAAQELSTWPQQRRQLHHHASRRHSGHQTAGVCGQRRRYHATDGPPGEAFVDSTQERFNTQTDPDGNPWKPLSPGYIKRKKKNQDLILTLNGYLRKYIAHQVLSANEVVWGSNRIYAAIHNWGGDGSGNNGTMPKRQYLGVSADDNTEAIAIVQDWLHRKLNGLPD